MTVISAGSLHAVVSKTSGGSSATGRRRHCFTARLSSPDKICLLLRSIVIITERKKTTSELEECNGTIIQVRELETKAKL